MLNWQIWFLKNLTDGNFVLQGDVQNASEVAQVEGVEFVLMPTRFHTELCSARAPCILESRYFSESFPFFQTLFVKLDMVVHALPILLLSSVSRDSVSEIVDPR